MNPSNAATVTIGALGFAVTGMALSPDGVLYGATVAKMPATSTLVTIDPYTARTTTIGPFVTTDGNATHTPDISFVGSRLFGSAGKNIASIDTVTARVSLTSVEVVGGGMGLVSPGPDTLLITLGPMLVTVNTATFTKAVGPKFSRNLGMDALTYVGGLLYGAEVTSTAPTSTLVTINPANGATTAIGPLPNNTDALAGIPGQVSPVPLAASEYVGTPLLQVSSLGSPTLGRTVRVAMRSVSLQELLSYGRDVECGGLSRRVVPLTALARLGLGARVVLKSSSGDVYVTTLRAPGLALVASYQHGLKLVDLRGGFQRVFGEIIDVRDASL